MCDSLQTAFMVSIFSSMHPNATMHTKKKNADTLCECMYSESSTHSLRAKKIIFKGIFPLDFSFQFTL